MTLAELKAKYGITLATKEPDVNCRVCSGRGERIRPSGEVTVCLCICEDHFKTTFASGEFDSAIKAVQTGNGG